jgi:hypothetical protein
MHFVADDVVTETPFGRLDGAEALHQSESGFAAMLTGATLIASFGDASRLIAELEKGRKINGKGLIALQ